MTKEVSCSYLPFWYLEAPRALSIEAMLGFAFPLTPPFQHKLVFADSSSRLCVGEPVISWKAEVPETEGLQARPRRAGKWTLESSTFVQQVSFHGQSFQHESQLIAAAVGTVPGAALMMVLSNGELFIGDVTNCEMSRCKTALEVGPNILFW